MAKHTLKILRKDFFSKCDEIHSFGHTGFGHIYYRNPNGKLHFLCSEDF